MRLRVKPNLPRMGVKVAACIGETQHSGISEDEARRLDTADLRVAWGTASLLFSLHFTNLWHSKLRHLQSVKLNKFKQSVEHIFI